MKFYNVNMVKNPINKAIYNNYIKIDTILPHNILYEGRCEFIIKSQICSAFNKRTRKYTVFLSHKRVTNQAIPANDSQLIVAKLYPSINGLEFKYEYTITAITIAVQVFKNEKRIINNIYPRVDKIVSEIFQNILLDFARYYNESLSGRDFLNPYANVYGPMIFTGHYGQNVDNSQATISNVFSLEKKHIGEIIKIDEVEQKDWRNYLNIARNKFHLCEYLDCILWCSISIESFIVLTLRDNNLEAEVIKYKRLNKGISFFKEVDILKKNSVITNKTAKMIIKVYGHIKESRNLIVHGETGPKSINKKTADKALSETISLYARLKAR